MADDSVRPLHIGLFFSDAAFDLDVIHQQLAPHQVQLFADWKSWDDATICEQVRRCDVVVTGRSSPALPQALTTDRGRCQLLAHCFGTVKHLVSKELLSAGLRVVNWGDNVSGVAESAMAMLLCCLKQLPALDAYIRADWSNDQRVYMDYPATLNGRDVGLYGFGPIGRHMARMLVPFGTRIHIYDPFATDIPETIQRCDSLSDLFDRCQCISIHCGLNAATRGSINRSLLERLPQGGIVINTARGPIIVEQDLADVVKQGRILAAVDVIEDEKNWPESPLAQQPSSGVLLTGHVVTSGKGSKPGTSKPKRGLPQHCVDNIHALANRQDLNYEITADIYDLKT